MALNPEIGDIIEIPTSNGFAYAQYTHRHDKFGALLRVLDGFFKSRPKEFDALVKRKHRFVIFFPLGAALRRKIFPIVGHAEVPDDAKDFPIFRSGAVGKNGKVATWWLWDGKKEWRIGHLTPEQRRLPIRGVVNYAALIQMIDSFWAPETDSR